MQAGITRFDSVFAGWVAVPLYLSGRKCFHRRPVHADEMGIKTGIDLEKIIDLAKRVRHLVGHDTDSYILKAGPSKELIREQSEHKG